MTKRLNGKANGKIYGIIEMLTFQYASINFNSHANCPGMLAVRYESHFARDKRQVQLLLFYQVGVAVAA